MGRPPRAGAALLLLLGRAAAETGATEFLVCTNRVHIYGAAWLARSSLLARMRLFQNKQALEYATRETARDRIVRDAAAAADWWHPDGGTALVRLRRCCREAAAPRWSVCGVGGDDAALVRLRRWRRRCRAGPFAALPRGDGTTLVRSRRCREATAPRWSVCGEAAWTDWGTLTD